MKIEELVNQALQKKQDERKDRKRSGCFSPSQFGKCYRAQVWNRRNEKPSNPIDERTLRVFKAGQLFHDFVQKLIPDIETEVKCESEDVLGFADVVTKDTVIDLKSQHSRAFHYMCKETYDIAKERYSNWLQVAYYAMTLNKPYASLVYISKDDLCIKQFTMPVSKWVDEVKKELTNLRVYWGADETPPACPRAFGGKEAKYCLYRDRCGGECK